MKKISIASVMSVKEMEEDTAASPVSSSVSITSNESIVSLPNLSDETLTSDPG